MGILGKQIHRSYVVVLLLTSAKVMSSITTFTRLIKDGFIERLTSEADSNPRRRSENLIVQGFVDLLNSLQN